MLVAFLAIRGVVAVNATALAIQVSAGRETAFAANWVPMRSAAVETGMNVI
jgi:hypothetical protein